MSAPIFSHSVRRALLAAAGDVAARLGTAGVREAQLAEAVALERIPEGDTDETRALFRSIGRRTRFHSLDWQGAVNAALLAAGYHSREGGLVSVADLHRMTECYFAGLTAEAFAADVIARDV